MYLLNRARRAERSLRRITLVGTGVVLIERCRLLAFRMSFWTLSRSSSWVRSWFGPNTLSNEASGVREETSLNGDVSLVVDFPEFPELEVVGRFGEGRVRVPLVDGRRDGIECLLVPWCEKWRVEVVE